MVFNKKSSNMKKKFLGGLFYLHQLISANPLNEKKIEEMLKLLFLYGESCSIFRKSLDCYNLDYEF